MMARWCRTAIVWYAVCLWLTACSGAGQHGAGAQNVEIDGHIVAVDSLIGDWAGQFVATDGSGDNGTIHFILHPGAQNGAGELSLYPNDGRGMTMIAMREVKIDRAGRIRIRLHSLADRRCRCDVRIEMTGQRTGDEMSGNYVSTSQGMLFRSGRWSMTRR